MRRKLDEYMIKFLNACKRHKVKITPQRVEIFKELNKYNEHPSVTKIYQRVKKKFPHISFDTVNRTLQKFVEIGIARVVEDFDDFKRYDGAMEYHHHFHCLKCHRIIDIYDEKLKGIEIPTLFDDRLNVLESRIVFIGLCDQCSQKSKEPKLTRNPSGF